MTIAVFMTIPAGNEVADRFCRYFSEQAPALAQAASGLRSIDLFVPATGRVVAFDQRGAPARLIQIDLDTVSAAEALLGSKELQRLLSGRNDPADAAQPVSVEITETVHFPVPGQASPPPREAPLSFVVRYYGPVADQAAFDRFYMDNHPPLLAKLPDVRNVLCYLPLHWQATGKVDDARMILGNEVVFDDLEALNRALQSDALPELIADGKRFQKFGYNSHYAMCRQRVYAGDSSR